MEVLKIIKKPLITEKTMLLTQEGKYTFVVDVKATKTQVKKAISDFFKVKVLKVWLIKMRGKKHRVGKNRRNWSKKSDFKKAIVKLTTGEKIELFEELKKPGKTRLAKGGRGKNK